MLLLYALRITEMFLAKDYKLLSESISLLYVCCMCIKVNVRNATDSRYSSTANTATIQLKFQLLC